MTVTGHQMAETLKRSKGGCEDVGVIIWKQEEHWFPFPIQKQECQRTGSTQESVALSSAKSLISLKTKRKGKHSPKFENVGKSDGVIREEGDFPCSIFWGGRFMAGVGSGRLTQREEVQSGVW